MHWRKKWQPTPVFLPGEANPRDGGAWWDAIYGVTQSRTRLTRLNSVLNGITYSMDMSLNKLWEIVKDREAWPSVLQSMGSQSQTRLSD